MEDDLFDAALDLEDQSYEEGYKLGVADGSKAGRIEGRAFGMEKGFEKFLAMGELHGKSCVWGARLPPGNTSTSQTEVGKPKEVSSSSLPCLPPLPQNPRLEKHIQGLYAMVEPETMSTLNTDDAVSEFDERYKRAVSKAKIIENIIGEPPVNVQHKGSSSATTTTTTTTKAEKSSRAEQRRSLPRVEGRDGNIEDFGLNPTLKP